MAGVIKADFVAEMGMVEVVEGFVGMTVWVVQMVVVVVVAKLSSCHSQLLKWMHHDCSCLLQRS